jgi:hypothetical protein
MSVVRRLYFYLISAVSLAVVGVGLVNLLRLALSSIWEALGGEQVISQDPDYLRRQLSLYTALIVVALPIWFFHWRAAERAARGAGAEPLAERGSPIRSLYLSLVLAVSFVFGLIAATILLERFLSWILNAPNVEFREQEVITNLAILVVALGIWSYHASVRVADERSAPPVGQSDSLPRLYRYAAAFVGAMLLLFGARDLIGLSLDSLFGTATVVPGVARWWAGPTANAARRTLVGLLVWALHAGYGQRLLEAPGWRGAAERASAARRFYLYLIVMVSVFATLFGVSQSLDSLLRLALDAEPRDAAQSTAQQLIQPLLGALPFALFWLEHRRRVLHEAARFPEDVPQATVRRLYTHVVALIGLILAGVGTVIILGVLLDLLLGESRTIGASQDLWRRTVAQFGALTLVGAAPWLWHWNQAQRRALADPAVERGASVRRVYLVAIIAAALISLLGTLAAILYRVLAIILGVERAGDFFDDMSTAVSGALVAAGLLGYHVAVLRTDQAARAEREETVGYDVPLVLSLPPGVDVDVAVHALSAQLPEGYRLRRGRR